MMSWVEVLAEVVKSHWSSSGKSFPLSQVKWALEDRGVLFASVLNGRKLKDAIIEEGGSAVRLVRNPQQPLVWGLLPMNVEVPPDLANVFGQAEAKSPSVQRLPRFGRGVWLAFAKPLKEGCRRYLEIGPPSRMVDVPEAGMPPPAGVELDPTFIYNASGELVPSDDHEAAVEQNIRDWAASKSIEIERLLVSARKPTSRLREAASYDFVDFSGLSTADKARIAIPLDLLSKIKFGR